MLERTLVRTIAGAQRAQQQLIRNEIMNRRRMVERQTSSATCRGGSNVSTAADEDVHCQSEVTSVYQYKIVTAALISDRVAYTRRHVGVGMCRWQQTPAVLSQAAYETQCR